MPKERGRIHISLDHDILDSLRVEAASTGIPMSRIIVKAIEGRSRLAIVERKGKRSLPDTQSEVHG